ncbi:MAG: divalent-cation tolerance protein CutA [Dehalococcoidales bacterium]|jgi:periplasmic divalent cation tolerance protein|nr:divalent-cation tolerance protein CutA [Dehalococcoidales bacterium]MDP6737997.1 divalent-cation tolerance protein CutA [Dehalococcoidales bacterium]|tara:strand:- start:314 stop:637 length:324 start_codon:yes stop_codon:yes gene_type:complete
MVEMSHIVVLVTTDTSEEAHKIADRLLNERKAACVNIVSGVSSFFWWQSKLDSAQEYLLVIKTRGVVLADVIRLVKQMHSNEIPEVVALPIVGGNPDYLEWLDKEVR